jgi:hypothetical protein
MQQKHCRTVIAGETLNYVEAPLKIWHGKISVICPCAECALPSSCDLLLSLQIFPHLTGLRAVHPLPCWEVCHMSVEHKEYLECHQQDPHMQCIYMEWHYCAGYVRFSQGQKAWKLFQQVQHEGVEQNSVTFVGFLNAFASVGGLEESKHVDEKINQSSCVCGK